MAEPKQVPGKWDSLRELKNHDSSGYFRNCRDFEYFTVYSFTLFKIAAVIGSSEYFSPETLVLSSRFR